MLLWCCSSGDGGGRSGARRRRGSPHGLQDCPIALDRPPTDSLRATVEAEPGATAGLAQVQPVRADAAAVEWRNTRYWRWQEEQQHAEPGLRPALLRLALASQLLQPRLAADARVGTAELPGDVVGVVGAALRR